MKVNKIGLSLLIIAVCFIVSPFISPSLETLVLFIVGFPVLAISFIFLFKMGGRLAKWKFKQACAFVLRTTQNADGKMYDFYWYNPNTLPDPFLPEKVRKFCYNPEFMLPAKGWHPGFKYNRMGRKVKDAIFPKKTAFFLFDEATGAPITYYDALQGYDKISPEFLKKICESKLASNFTKFPDAFKAGTGRIWIFAIIGIVAIGVILKLTGAL